MPVDNAPTEEDILLLCTELQLQQGQVYPHWALEFLRERALLGDYVRYRDKRAKGSDKESLIWVRMFLRLNAEGATCDAFDQVINRYLFPPTEAWARD